MSREKKDLRPRCPFCGAVTWNRDYAAFMREHDRPQGGRCLQARGVTVVSAAPVSP